MKRYFAALLAVLLLAVMTACHVQKQQPDGKTAADGASGSSSAAQKSEQSTTASTTLSSQRAERVANEIEHGQFESFAGYNEEEKEKIKQSVERDGYTLEYHADGSATLSNEEGEWFVGKGWVQNEFTEGLPPVTFGKVTMSAENTEQGETYYIFLIRSATVTQVADYVEALQAAGFAPSSAENVVDIDNGIISFDAENAAGKHVSVGYSVNGFTLKISRKA